MPNKTLDQMLLRLRSLQQELENEIDRILKEKQNQFQYTLEQGKVRFEQGIKALQRHQKIGLIKYLAAARLGHILTAPIIYSVFFAFVLLDIMVTIYQHTCFRVYGIPRVNRHDYFAIDRQQLAYLNAIEKFNCMYCGYGNGLIEYSREIVARTEQYWCPIKHARRTPDPHRLVEGFVDYGDAQSYKDRLVSLQNEIASLSKNNKPKSD